MFVLGAVPTAVEHCMKKILCARLSNSLKGLLLGP